MEKKTINHEQHIKDPYEKLTIDSSQLIAKKIKDKKQNGAQTSALNVQWDKSGFIKFNQCFWQPVLMEERYSSNFLHYNLYGQTYSQAGGRTAALWHVAFFCNRAKWFLYRILFLFMLWKTEENKTSYIDFWHNSFLNNFINIYKHFSDFSCTTLDIKAWGIQYWLI